MKRRVKGVCEGGCEGRVAKGVRGVVKEGCEGGCEGVLRRGVVKGRCQGEL